MELTDQAYDIAWTELRSRYDNRRVLMATHMRALLNSAATSKASAVELKRLISVALQARRSFESLGRPVGHWDDWFVHVLVEKLDSSTRLAWEASLQTSTEFPTFSQLQDFLHTRIRALDAANLKGSASTAAVPSGAAAAPATETSDSSPSPKPANAEKEAPPSTAVTSNVAALAASSGSAVLLTTALVTLTNEHGEAVVVRALLDSGSEASFLSERVARALRLSRRRVHVPVTGLQGASTGVATHAVSATMSSPREPDVRLHLPELLVLPKLTAEIPRCQVARRDWPHLSGLPLADPYYDRPAAVDAILGAGVFGRILQDGLRLDPNGTPSAQQTTLGWVLMG